MRLRQLKVLAFDLENANPLRETCDSPMTKVIFFKRQAIQTIDKKVGRLLFSEVQGEGLCDPTFRQA